MPFEYNLGVMRTVTAKQARQNFADIIDEVHYTGIPVTITKSGKPVVILTSTKFPPRKKGKPNRVEQN